MRASSAISRALAGAAALSLAALSAVAAEIQLDRLSACGDISLVLQQLRNAPQQSGDDCRQPSNAVERGVAKALSSNGHKSCFLRRPPLSLLSDFGCLRTSVGRQEGLTCVRPSDLQVITDYRDGYKSRYAAAVSNYLRLAAGCPGSNGDAGIGPVTTFSPFLVPVASHELNFISQYGTTRPGNAAVYHSFARTSPEVSRYGIEAIEVVAYTWSPDNSEPQDVLNYSKLGNWRIQVDDGSVFATEFTKVARRKGLSVTAGAFDVKVMRSADAPALDASPSLADELSSKAIENLKDEGFEAMSEADLRRNAGMDSTEMMEKVAEQMPFGSKALMSRFMTNPRVTILMRTGGPSCTSNGRGAFGAYVLRNDGERNVKADHGSVSVFLLGFGACGRSLEANNAYIRELVSDAKEVVLKELKRR